MKTNKIFILTLILACFACKKQTTPEATPILKPFTYDEQYYKNLRDFKKSDHQISYGWFADYSQKFSMGYHFSGLPDSLDICSLWGGIPSAIGDPISYKEMLEMRKIKGTRLVAPFITRIQSTKFPLSDEGIKAYADDLLAQVFNNDLDGLDCDYEPEGDWLQGENFTKFITYLGQFLGPKSKNPDKLLIIDFYNQLPDKETEPFANYFVRQSYAANSDGVLDGQWNQMSSWCPSKKFIVTENIGDYWPTGGVSYTQANGNKKSIDGTELHSLEGMSQWEPSNGRKGGFGAFYLHRDYNSTPPYKYFRRGIQLANPAIR